MSAETQHAFDLERLLEPISPERPSGGSIRDERAYDRIADARREDDPRLSRGIYESELKRADWNAVEALATEALSTRTKDLQVAAWLAEAWTQLYGLAGAREGLRLMKELCERFWETMHPELRGGDCEARASTVVWVNEKLSLKLKRQKVSSPRAGDLPAYSYAELESALYLENVARRDPKAMRAAEERGEVTLAKFNSSLTLTDTDFYEELRDDADSALKACEELEELFGERCGGDAAPGLGRFRETLEGIGRVAEDVLRSRPDAAHAGYGHYEDGEPAAAAYEAEHSWSPGSPIRSRAEAYQRLAEAADYLLMTEPHSPTPYLVRRAVEWGSMSLHEVLQQVVRNDAEMQELNRLLRLSDDGGGRT